jgi:Ca2+-binding EF-hand superfamily protein
MKQSLDNNLRDQSEYRAKAVKKIEARKRQNKLAAVFRKHDKDQDGQLNKKEIQAFSKSEYKFSMSLDKLNEIFESLVTDGSRGVKLECFARLKIAIGIARELARDQDRRKVREAKEAKLKELRFKFEERLEEVKGEVVAAEDAASKAEALSLGADQPKDVTAQGMQTTVEEAEAMIVTVKELADKAKASLQAIGEEPEGEIKEFVAESLKNVEHRLGRLIPRQNRFQTVLGKFRETAKAKELDELAAIKRQGLALVLHHKKVKQLSPDEMFKEFCGSKDKIAEDAFLSFFENCERPEAKTGEDGTRVESCVMPPEEELSRLFSHLDEEGECALDKIRFLRFIRVFMKVIKENVCTEGVDIKSKSIRRLAVGEVVEILEGPVTEENDVQRVRVKVMKDQIEAWVTMSGNHGNVFLEEGGSQFKVVKETVLTDNFDITKGGSKKLKLGDIVDVIEWPTKEEAAGLLRLKVKVLKTGNIGWATILGNQGNIFLEVV